MKTWATQLLQRPVVRFLVVGGGVAALDFATFLVLVQADVSTGWANIAGMTLGFFAGLWGHHAVTFRVPEPLHWRTVLRYALSFGFNLALGSLALKALLVAAVPAAVAKFITIALVAASNFLVSRYFVFRRP
jgi:putative flippase GtrA